jgi:hypothetical protein
MISPLLTQVITDALNQTVLYTYIKFCLSRLVLRHFEILH